MKTMADKILILLCVLSMLIFGISIYLLPKDDFSEKENRVLADYPSVSLSSVFSGEFSSGLGRFYSDRFAQREFFTGIKCKLELALGRAENNGVTVGKNGYLFSPSRINDKEAYADNLRTISDFCSRLGREGKKSIIFFAPRGADVCRGALPDGYQPDSKVWEMASELCPEHLSAVRELCSAFDAGEYVWFMTDHHFTARGAYISYLSICRELGCEPRSGFDSEYAEGFYGSAASKLGLEPKLSDTVEILRCEADKELFCVDYDTGRVESGVYRYEYADKRDKYSIFMGGNHGHIGVYSNGAEPRKTLYVIKDSFANSVLPFLALDYDLEVYDLRYFGGDINAEIAEAETVLLLFGIDTVIDDRSFWKLEDK